MGEARGVHTVKKCVLRPQEAVCGVILVGCVATAVGRVLLEREMKNMVEILVNLVAGRHDTIFEGQVITEAVWSEPLTGAEMHDHSGLTEHARDWLESLPPETDYVNLFVTGLTACTVAFLQAYVDMQPIFGLSLLFYDRDKESYSERVWNYDYGYEL